MSEKPARRVIAFLLNFLKITAWTLMAVILAVSAVLICTVKILKPAALTPLAEQLANKYLEAQVDIDTLKLEFKPVFPILRASVDGLTVVSHALNEEQLEALPVYSDTLLTVNHFAGSIDLGKLLAGHISLHDVKIDGPQANIVIAEDGTANYLIFPSEPDSVNEPLSVPSISIDHFRLTNPKAIRFYSAQDSTSATIVLLQDMDINGTEEPVYRLRIDGNLESPLTRQLVNLSDLQFGIDGALHWTPDNPVAIELENFTMRGAFLQARLNAAVDFGDTLRIHRAEFFIDSLKVEDFVTVLPDSIVTAHHLRAPFFRTDMAVSAHGRLVSPYVPDRDTIPYMDLSVNIPASSLTYGRARFHDIALNMNMQLRGPDLDRARVEIENFTISGRATNLSAAAVLTNLESDLNFDGTVDGSLNLGDMSIKVRQYIDGVATGNLNMNLHARGSLSMMQLNQFHRLDITGNLVGNNLYYLKADTSHAVNIHRASINFGSLTRVRHPENGNLSAPSLVASVNIDSCRMLLGGVGMSVDDLRLGVGIENSRSWSDTSVIKPIGGGLHIGRLNVLNITDSAGMRLRNLDGRVFMRRYKNGRYPEIELRADIGRLSAGSALARLMISDAGIQARTHLIPSRARRRKEIKHISDSLAALFPDMSQDSVYALAVEHRRHRRGRRHITTSFTPNDNEVIDFHLSNGFNVLLTDWRLEGTLSSNRARFFTPYFPLRNRIEHLDLAFSNDSIILNGVEYKVGHSDISAQGIISDIARSLTSRRHSPLKINLQFVSDTIDVNQLAAATFAGASFSERLSRGSAHVSKVGNDEDDERFDELEEAAAGNDTLAPILIPTNIEASIGLQARNLYYSDLHFTGIDGELLMYDGAVNLNRFRASSEVGSMALSALYAAPRARDIKFGMSLDVRDFVIERFLSLVLAVDTIMPMVRDFSGTINADIAATVDIDSVMNLELPTLSAAVHLSGDSLAFIDPETYRILGKWLRFRDRADNHINHMSVQLIVQDNRMEIFPFKFNIDRYTLGVTGYNDLAMNFDYHISVLKSPLPFKFGINIKGTPEKYKIRLGGARYRDGVPSEQVSMIDTVRVNLLSQISQVFRRGVQGSRFARLNLDDLGRAGRIDLGVDTLTHADSLALIREGLIPAPAEVPENQNTRRRR